MARYVLRHPETGQFVREFGDIDKSTGKWKIERIELVDRKATASHYDGRMDAQPVFEAAPGIDWKVERA